MSRDESTSAADSEDLPAHHQAGTEVSTAALETLAQSVIQGDFAQVQRLATSQLVSKPDAANRTVLMLVADAPETPIQAEKCVMYLFELGANQKSIIDDSGDTAAHLAARRDHLRLLMLLSFDAKWLQNRRGATPLMEAARTGSWRCAKHLLHLLRQRQFYKPQAGKPSNSVRERLLGLKDVEGRTAFDLARINGHSELANYIKREMRLTVDAYDSITGLTEKELAEQGELEKLIRAGDWTRLRQKVTRANCDLPDSSGFTALIRAAQSSNCNDEALWEVLVQLGDPTCAETLSRTCLHWSASSGNSVAASILLAAGVSANAREDRNKSTPLMQAALYAPKETAVQVSQILLDAGSDWSLKDSCSKTALDLIRSDGNPDLVKLLQKYKGKKFYEEPLKPPHEDPPFMERWDVGDLIGRGGFGEVYKVLTDKGIQCVAKIIKLPVGQLTTDQYAQDRTKIDKAVESERNLCRLQHKNIVRFLHIAQTEPATIFLFMELLEGKTLETFINGAPMPENKIRDFSEQICSALLYMHSRRPPVIHRDINCSNIMVLSEGTRIKLIDFGLSIELKLSVSHNLASTQTPRGTHNFMAPELLGAGEADTSPQYSRESDIWAFGCSVYQMATRQRPFHSASNLLTIAQLIKNNGCPKLPPGCSKELEDFYRSCTTQNRSKRQSALELMRHQFLTGGEITRMRLMTNRLHRAASIS